MLAELSRMEQRYDAVLAVIRDGLSVSEAVATYGVSRQSVYRWMQRYEAGGLPALAERSHRPKTCPHLRCRRPRQVDPGWSVVASRRWRTGLSDP